MKKALGILALLLGITISALPSRADGVSMTLTGVSSGGYNIDGVYTSPYTATVGGAANTPVICDDFADDSYIGESWSATVSTVADLAGNVKWGSETNAQQNYDIAAWLAEQLFAPGVTTTQTEDISFAIWLALDPTDVTNYLTNTSPDPGTLSAAQGWINTAENAISTQDLTSADFANVLVYTEVPGTAVDCNGGACPANSPQEFLVVTPEPGSLVLLLVGLIALVGIAYRRRNTIALAAAN
ncbi:MAG TPA: PEP-CTERM sorting domain-containing protein [Candidatus Baltobacteraceae bacterium]|nr:PEP-CTERM sorting domain-containing protein [Candidatus Baltobacteraceae bacterium]